MTNSTLGDDVPVTCSPIAVVNHGGYEMLFFLTIEEDGMMTIDATHRLLSSDEWTTWSRPPPRVVTPRQGGGADRPKINTPLAACTIVPATQTKETVSDSDAITFLYHINKANYVVRMIVGGPGIATDFGAVRSASTSTHTKKRNPERVEVVWNGKLAAIAFDHDESRSRFYCQHPDYSIQEYICNDSEGLIHSRGKSFGIMLQGTALAAIVSTDGGKPVISVFMQNIGRSIVEFQYRNDSWTTARIVVERAPMQSPLTAISSKAWRRVVYHSETTVNHLESVIDAGITYLKDGMVDEDCLSGSQVAASITKCRQPPCSKARKRRTTRPGLSNCDNDQDVIMIDDDDEEAGSSPEKSSDITGGCVGDHTANSDERESDIQKPNGQSQNDEETAQWDLRVFYQALPDQAITDLRYRSGEVAPTYNIVTTRRSERTVAIQQALGPRSENRKQTDTATSEKTVIAPNAQAVPPGTPPVTAPVADGSESDGSATAHPNTGKRKDWELDEEKELYQLKQDCIPYKQMIEEGHFPGRKVDHLKLKVWRLKDTGRWPPT